jgi:hypothetical protein
MRRAIVIGLGDSTRPLLDTIQKQFEQMTGADQFSSLCLVSGDDSQSHPDSLPLHLSKEQFNELYFRSNARIWSGPNWRTWGRAIATNRLLGKLAIFYYLEQVRNAIHGLASQPGHDPKEQLNLYLVAPLHDPFASGALIDVAYLLHKLALERNAKVYGILLLPGMTDDPTGKSLTDERQIILAQTYATLRELNFYCGGGNFYGNHHPGYPLEFENDSPFKTGDCYLTGGEQDEKGSVLDYSRVKKMIAEFVALQTLTPMADSIPVSDKSQSWFSSFGVDSQALIADADVPNQLDEIIRQTLNALIAPPKADEASTIWLTQSLSLRFTDDVERELEQSLRSRPQRLSVLARAPGRSQFQFLAEADRLHREHLEYAQQFEVRLTTAIQEKLSTAREDINERLQEIVQRRGANLRSIASDTEHIHQVIEGSKQANQRELDEAEDNLPSLGTSLRNARARYAYASTPSGLQNILTGIGAVIGILAFILLMLMGQSLPGLGVGVVVLGAYFVSTNQYQRQMHEAKIEFNATQREWFLLHLALIRKRASNLYLHQLESEFRRRTQRADGRSRLQAVIADIDQWINQLPGNAAEMDAPVVDTAPLIAFVIPDLELFGQAWPHLDRERIQKRIIEGIHRSDDINKLDDVSRLRRGITKSIERTRIQLSVNSNLIATENRKRVHYVIGLQGYRDLVMHKYREDIRDSSQSLVMLDAQTSKVPIVSIIVRTDIPLHTLFPIRLWRSYYRSACRPNPDSAIRMRALLHPTRVGMSVPDIYNQPLPQTLLDFSATGMIVSLLLRQLLNKDRLSELAEQLQVSWQTQINFDEMCGALHEDIHELENYFTQAEQINLDQTPESILVALLQRFPAAPKTSEDYADWEVWAYHQLVTLARSVRYSETRRLVAQLSIGLSRRGSEHG